MKKILTIVSILLFAVIIVACGKKDFKVTFVTNGGTAVSAVDVKSGDKISEPTTTKKAHKVDGWYTTENFAEGTKWNFAEDTVTANITLYVKWVEDNKGERIDFSDLLKPKTTIRVWMDDEKGDYMRALIAEFNKLYPEIIVEHQHMGTVESREKLKTFGPSGNGADVFQFPHDHLAQAKLEDLVLTLPNSTKTILTERSHPVALQVATLDGEVVGVPNSLESVGLYYNKDLVDTPATTFEELLAEAAIWNAAPNADDATRTNAQAGVYYLGTSSHWADSYFMQFAYSAFGFTPFGPQLNDPTSVGFNTPATIAALTWMRDSLKPAVTGTGATDSVTAGANFENGKLPYIIAGPWNAEAYKAKGVNYGIAKMPTIKVGDENKETKTFAGAQITAVYKYSQNQDAAIKWVEFLTSDIAMKLQYDYKYKLPALKEELLQNIPGVLDDELMNMMSEQLATSVPMPVIPEVTYYWGPGESMIKEIWNNNKAITTAVADAEASYKALSGR